MSNTSPMPRLIYGLLSKFLRLILAIITILSGWQIAFILTNMSPWIYWSGIIFVLILGVLVGWLSGLFKSLWKYVNSYRTSTKPAITHNAPSKPVEVARISYKLDDPEDQEQFDAFLDKDAFTFISSLPNHVFNYIMNAENACACENMNCN